MITGWVAWTFMGQEGGMRVAHGEHIKQVLQEVTRTPLAVRVHLFGHRYAIKVGCTQPPMQCFEG